MGRKRRKKDGKNEGKKKRGRKERKRGKKDKGKGKRSRTGVDGDVIKIT